MLIAYVRTWLFYFGTKLQLGEDADLIVWLRPAFASANQIEKKN